MISFDLAEGRFNSRSVAVLIHSNHILIHRSPEEDFWTLPGGRVEFLETSDITVKREILEELGLDCDVIRQLWHIENFFEYNGIKCHELADFFWCHLLPQPELNRK